MISKLVTGAVDSIISYEYTISFISVPGMWAVPTLSGDPSTASVLSRP
jgi:hypothetical protein